MDKSQEILTRATKIVFSLEGETLHVINEVVPEEQQTFITFLEAIESIIVDM